MLTFKCSSYMISIIFEAEEIEIEIEIASSCVLISFSLSPSNPKVVDFLTSWVVYEIQ
jgi:hypothetical protein